MATHEERSSTNDQALNGAARERDELGQDYAKLQKKLHDSLDRAETAEILRQLATYRHQLSILDDDLRTAPLESDDVPVDEYERSADAGLIASPHTRSDTPVGDGQHVEHAPARRTRRAQSTQPRSETTSRPRGAPSLVIRLLVEGSSRAAVATVATTLAEQFRATTVRARSVHHDMAIDWTAFSAGSFESRPIHFELIAVDQDVDSTTRSYLRSMVDAIVFVVESTADGVRAGRRALHDLAAAQSGREVADRAALTVFAHKSSGSEAPHADLVTAALGLDPSIRVVSTVGPRHEFFYGFAVVASAAVKRARLRDQKGLPRTARTRLQAILPPVGAPFELTEIPRRRRSGKPATATATAAATADEPTTRPEPRRPPSVVGHDSVDPAPDPDDDIETPIADPPATQDDPVRAPPTAPSAAAETKVSPRAGLRPSRLGPERAMPPLRALPGASTSAPMPPPPTQHDRVLVPIASQDLPTGRASALRRMIAAVHSPGLDNQAKSR